MDTSLKGSRSGIDLVREISGRFPGLPCLMYSGHGDRAHVARALEAGARGYLTKDDPTELGEAIATVLSGEIYLGSKIRKQQPPGGHPSREVRSGQNPSAKRMG